MSTPIFVENPADYIGKHRADVVGRRVPEDYSRLRSMVVMAVARKRAAKKAQR